jgi:hypothetical protein
MQDEPCYVSNPKLTSVLAAKRVVAAGGKRPVVKFAAIESIIAVSFS